MSVEQVEFKGISQFFYFAIPAVLVLAAIWWLAFGEGLHYFKRALSQEKRHAEIVGVTKPLKEAVKIVISDTRDAAVRIDRAEIDGGDLWIYYKNFGDSRVDFIEFTYKLISPDGTVVKQESSYIAALAWRSKAPGSLDPGERGEAHLKIAADPRAETLNVRMGK